MPPDIINTEPVQPDASAVAVVPPTFSIMGIPFDPNADTFVVKGAGNFAVAHVKKSDGCVHSVRVQANGALKEYAQFDPSKLTTPERRQLEHGLYARGLKQTDISDLIGVSQATVSNDLKRIEADSEKARRS